MNADDGQRFAEAAHAFLGVPFRLHGRDPRTGLDCIGLVAASLTAIGREPVPPRRYALRNSEIGQWLGNAESSGFALSSGKFCPGDLLLTKPGAGQHHVMIASKARHVIHAHAGLGRVVHQPLDSKIAIIRHWRLEPAG